MIAQFSYNARYAKYREAKNLYFPESGLFPRPADLQPYIAISSVVILIFLFFCARPFARAISNRWPDHSLSFHYLYKYIYKNTADDMSAPWTRHRRYRFILWVFLCGSGISVSSVRIRLHCKHGSIQPDAILSRTLKGFHGHRRKFLIQS